MQFTATRIATALLSVFFASGCAAPAPRAMAPEAQVLFVCEHGNVKSLMAASYFNQLAQERGLRVRAISRGSAPNSASVPAAIVEGLGGDGFDVTDFHPVAVSAGDVSVSLRVVTIGIELPPAVRVAGVTPEAWDDVPPASVNYAAARNSLMGHVRRLVEQMTHSAGK